jgi:hypothetical protein
MTPDINVGRPHHLSSDSAYTEIGRCYEAEKEISDACAVTIASWWAGPDVLSQEFTRLATSGSFNPRALLEEISIARTRIAMNTDHRALDMLATWAMHRHDEEVE